MKTSKRLLSLLLAVVMVITTCSVGMSAFAADDSEDVFTYVTDEGKAVDITYESLNNLVNTYAPEIIKLINQDGKLTELGVDVDAVCASEKPIYELLAQLSPTLIQLMGGSSGDSDAVIKSVLIDAGAIPSTMADSDKERAMRFIYAQYSYLDDDDATMSIWSLYKFCMDNEKSDDKDLKKYCTNTKDALKPLIMAFSNAYDVAKTSVSADFATVEEYVRTKVIGSGAFQENAFAGMISSSFFAPYLLNAPSYGKSEVEEASDVIAACGGAELTAIPATLAEAKKIVASGSAFKGKNLAEINASSDSNVAAFINKVVEL